MPYNETTLRFVTSTTWDGLLDTEYVGTVGTKGEGPFATISLQLQGDVVEAARFETYSCPAARASCAVLCWAIEGKGVGLCSKIEAEDVTLLLGGLPDGKGHLPSLAVQALRSALEKLRA